MLDAGVSQLRAAFHKHGRNLEDYPNNLLLFYAVECGLKAIWLRRNRLRTTAQLSPDLKARGGHDLMFWVSKLGLPASVTQGRCQFRLKNSSGMLDIVLAHQAWRYAIELNEEDEAAVVKWLHHIREWIFREIGI
jgi:hypothetical protein